MSVKMLTEEGQDSITKELISFAAVFGMSRNTPPKGEGGALRDIQKTAAKETTKQ